MWSQFLPCNDNRLLTQETHLTQPVYIDGAVILQRGHSRDQEGKREGRDGMGGGGGGLCV